MAPSPYRRRLFWLLLLTALVRLLLAGSLELGNDEVYYWTYAQHLEWNYFDHPPLVALSIRLFTLNLELQYEELFVRLGSIAGCALSTVLLFHTVRRLHSERSAWYTAVLYNVSVYGSIIAGLFILPDSPQMVFWCAALFYASRLPAEARNWKPWLLFGLMAGLSILGKVHGIFLWFGMGVYVLFCERSWLARPQLWTAALLSAAIASPILFWNLQNDFITWRFHSERVTVREWALNTNGFLRELGGQILYNNPVNEVLLAIALAAFFRNRRPWTPALRLLAFTGLPMIATLLGIALLRDTLPHWSGPGYVTLLPLAAIFLATGSLKRAARFLGGAAAFILLLCTAGAGLAWLYPGTMGSRHRHDYGFGDFTLDLHGWREAAPAFTALYRQEEIQGYMPHGAPLLAHRWFPAAHLDYYFAAPHQIPVIGLGSLPDLHHYAWVNRKRLRQVDMTKAWTIVPSNIAFDPRTQFSGWYRKADSVTTITQFRNGAPARYFTVWRLSRHVRAAKVPVQ